jgi:transposase
MEQWGRIYPGILEMDAPPLKGFYRAMDVLWKHRDDVEGALFDRGGERDLFNRELDVVFFDLTTLYFESVDTDEGELRRFGYSKEHRNDCTQVMLGLLVDREGIPVGYHLFPGNTYEPHSLPAILEKLKARYHIQRVLVVADRGLITKENVGELRKAGMDFILGMKLWMMSAEEQEAVLDKTQYRSLGKEGDVLIRETTHKGERLVLTWSRTRAERDAALRRKVLERLRTQLTPGATLKRFVTHKGYRQYLKGLDEGAPALDEQAVLEAERRDGFFGVLTSVSAEKMSGAEIFERYHDLWHVEDAFGEIKGPLETRPMFHWVDPRIQSHVLLCLLAYYVEAIMIREFRKAETNLTVGRWFRALNEIYAIPVDVRGTRAWVRNEIRGEAAEGYEIMALRPPDRLLKIEKIEYNEESEESVVTRNFSEKGASA